jgi:nicotinamide-nucleotide amidase
MAMAAEIMIIGTEILLGQIVDTNAAFIAEKLAAAGIDVYYKTVVGDNEKRIETALRQALERSDIVIAAGGLGPTEDDLTRTVFARVLGRRLVLNQELLEKIRQRFASRGLVMSPNNEKQALVPQNAIILENPRGTAPGLFMKAGARGEKVVVAMPGVPLEMKLMLTEQVIPRLKEYLGQASVISSRVIKTCGIGESKVDELIGDLFRASRNPSLALLAYPSEVHIRITAKAESEEAAGSMIEDLEGKVRERVAEWIYGRDQESMEEVVGKLLQKAGQTISVAESCTGGLICNRITDVPGSSRYFERGIVCYSNRSKVEVLGVPSLLLERYGAVSAEVAEAMARGVRELGRSDLGLAVTGIAGPEGGTPEKPVGLVYIALAWKGGVRSKEYRFFEERLANKARSSLMALEMVRRHLLGLPL